MKTRIVCMLLASALSAAAGAETVVVVSAKSAVATLSKEQVADLFVGKTQQLGGASAAPALIWWKCTPRMVIFCTSFSRRWPINALTNTAAAWKTARG